MNYFILKDQVYIYLLAYCDGLKMRSYCELGRLINLSRQTVSVRVKELLNQKLIEIDDNKIVKVNNILNLDINNLKKFLDESTINYNPVDLRMKIAEERNEIISQRQAGKDLGIAIETTYRKKDEVVYGIVVDNELKYIGATKYFKSRIRAHMEKRKFLTKDNFIIIKRIEGEGSNVFALERELIKTLSPEWNILGKD